MVKYQFYFQKWEEWSRSFQEVNPLPSQEQHLILFLMSQFQSAKSYPVLEASYCAIKHFHAISGYSIGTSLVTKHLLEAFKRLLAYTPKKKKNLVVEDLRRIFEKLHSVHSLKNSRTLAICLLSFSAFLRFDECQKLRRSDIKFFHDHATIFIQSSKTDVYRQGHWVYIAKLNSNLCPVRGLERYLDLANIENYSENFIFRGVTKSKQSERLWFKDQPISYSSVRDDIKRVIKDIDLDHKQYGVHSLRSGGASAAANLGVPDRLIMKHGRWKSVGVKNRYISEDLENLLYTSRNLGL